MKFVFKVGMGETFSNQASLPDCGHPWLKHMITDVWTLEPSPDTPCIKSRPDQWPQDTDWPPPTPFTSQISSTAQSAIPPSKAPGLWTIRKTRNIPDTLTSCVNLPLIFFKTLLKCPLRVMLSLDICLNHLSLSFSHTHTLFSIVYPLSLPALFLSIVSSILLLASF